MTLPVQIISAYGTTDKPWSFLCNYDRTWLGTHDNLVSWKVFTWHILGNVLGYWIYKWVKNFLGNWNIENELWMSPLWPGNPNIIISWALYLSTNLEGLSSSTHPGKNLICMLFSGYRTWVGKTLLIGLFLLPSVLLHVFMNLMRYNNLGDYGNLFASHFAWLAGCNREHIEQCVKPTVIMWYQDPI